MKPPDEPPSLAATLAAELDGMPEEDRLRAKRIVQLLVANLEELERRVRQLEERNGEV